MEKDTGPRWQFRTPAAYGVEDEAGRTKTSRSTLIRRALPLYHDNTSFHKAEAAAALIVVEQERVANGYL